MFEPVCVQRVNAGMLRFGNLRLELFDLIEHAVVSHAAHRGHAAKTDRQKIQPSGNQIPLLDGAQQRGVQHPKTRDLTLLLGLPCGFRMRRRIAFHQRKLLHGRKLGREFNADLYILRCFRVECHA